MESLKEYWLIDVRKSKEKLLNFCKAKNLKESKAIFESEAEVENYTLSECVITIAEVYYN